MPVASAGARVSKIQELVVPPLAPPPPVLGLSLHTWPGHRPNDPSSESVLVPLQHPRPSTSPRSFLFPVPPGAHGEDLSRVPAAPRVTLEPPISPSSPCHTRGTWPSWWVEMRFSPPPPTVGSPQGRRPGEGGEEGERAAPSGRLGGLRGRSPRAPRRSPEPGFSGAGRAGDVGGRGSWLLGEPAPGEQSLPGWVLWAGRRPPSQGTPARRARVATCSAVRPVRPALRLRSPGLRG